MRWELHVNRNVVSYLVSLREQGHALRTAIFSLQQLEKLEPGDKLILLSDNIYLWRIEDHMVTFEVLPTEKRIYVTAVAVEKKDLEEE